jgi:dGTPase
MRPYGGFEHNLQSLRVVDELEERYAEFRGLNLTFECREGILKHCSLRNARELGDLGVRFIQRRQPGLEAQLANLADEIAYNNHDVDDGLRAQLIDIRDLGEVALFRKQYDAVVGSYPSIGERRLIHETVRRMINYIVVNLVRHTQAQLIEARPASADDVRAHPRPLVGLSEEIRKEHVELMEFLREHVYRHYKVLRMTSKARRVVKQLFEAFFDDVTLMPPEHRQVALEAESNSGPSGRARVVADYIAGMTDRYAILEHQRLFDPAERS